ncbi:fimbrial protein [Trabulsiella odontotermitis]|uniref:Fimbrial protein n=1 Tax=Trabulsiella odontotermitis TaxID=379893 RepID=A0A0L0H4T6_9ENTR|nr:fimbrial protein [Trabulsiella odontotermitis]KNC95728.1 fimbrial protein [Trabulsiella odontotermitis]
MTISKALLLPVFSCALLSSLHASASTVTPGKLSMSGELIEAACAIDPASRDIEVEFGDVSASLINQNEEGNVTRPFLVRLTGCTVVKSGNGGSHFPYATVTFIGNATDSDPTTLLISGAADGFGIRLRDRNSEILTIGKPSMGYELSDEDNVLKFTASLVPVQQHIKAGEFYAIAQVFMDYN